MMRIRAAGTACFFRSVTPPNKLPETGVERLFCLTLGKTVVYVVSHMKNLIGLVSRRLS